MNLLWQIVDFYIFTDAHSSGKSLTLDKTVTDAAKVFGVDIEGITA